MESSAAAGSLVSSSSERGASDGVEEPTPGHTCFIFKISQLSPKRVHSNEDFYPDESDSSSFQLKLVKLD